MADNGYVNKDLLRTMILTPTPLEGEKTVYLGPRKTDDAPQATFNYGDGTYVIQFHYTKDGKANEKSGSCGASADPEDKKGKAKLGEYQSYHDPDEGGTW